MTIFSAAEAKFVEATRLAIDDPDINPIVVDGTSEVLQLRDFEDVELGITLSRPLIDSEAPQAVRGVTIQERVARWNKETREVREDVVARVIVSFENGTAFEAVLEGTEYEYHRTMGPGECSDIETVIDQTVIAIT